jgi:hypothetical protein
MKKWCKHVITLPYHLGGFGITPLVQSGKAGFYYATAKFFSWLGTLPNAQFWLPAHHDLHQPATWSCQRLKAFTDLHRHFCSELNFTEWAPPAALASDQVPPPRSAVLTLPPPTLLATLQVLLREDNDNAAQRPEIPPQRNITREIMKQLFSVHPEAPLQRAGQMVHLHKDQSVPTIRPTREEDPRAYSILRHDMPHREDAPPDAQHHLTYSTTSWISPHYMQWLPKQYTAGSRLTLQGWQS